MSSVTVQVPLLITVQLGGTVSATAATQAALPAPDPQGALERVAIDPDYSTRRGYDPAFLGIEVALPRLTDEQRRNAAKNARAAQGSDNTVLPYHHFSVVMNRRRQLAYYTAVNIDGAQARKPARTGDKWSFDPRIAQSEQIGEDLYTRNSLDRGHLVRRLDPAWGSPAQALLANDDTFHFTNCSPQHERFNQNNATWQGIENYLLAQATSAQRRLSIFTGPVMTDDDPLYRGVRIPTQFWKVAAFAAAPDRLHVSAYLLGQEELLDGLERFEPDVFQVTLDEIMGRTGLDFSHLAPAAVAPAVAGGLEAAGEWPQRRIGVLADITL